MLPLMRSSVPPVSPALSVWMPLLAFETVLLTIEIPREWFSAIASLALVTVLCVIVPVPPKL